MTRWEYRISRVDIPSTDPGVARDCVTDHLNDFGSQGWELVTYIPGGTSVVTVWKRQRY